MNVVITPQERKGALVQVSDGRSLTFWSLTLEKRLELALLLLRSGRQERERSEYEKLEERFKDPQLSDIQRELIEERMYEILASVVLPAVAFLELEDRLAV